MISTKIQMNRFRVHLLTTTVFLLTVASYSDPSFSAELRDAEFVAAGAPVVQNVSGTVRLENSRVGGLGSPVFAVPEPHPALSLSAGAAFLIMLRRRRRRNLD